MIRKEISTRIGEKYNPKYTKIRRDALLAMGFCPDCLEWNNRFPSRICTECCRVVALKERHRILEKKNGKR